MGEEGKTKKAVGLRGTQDGQTYLPASGIFREKEDGRL